MFITNVSRPRLKYLLTILFSLPLGTLSRDDDDVDENET